MSPALARALRTLLQGLIAALGTVSLNTIFNGVDPTLIGAFQIMLTAFVSQLQNALEDSGTIPTVLKNPPIATAPLVAPAEQVAAARPLRAAKKK